MPNTTDQDWSEASPSLSEPRRDGALEIVSLRGAVRDRLEKEHVAPAAGGVGGEHSAGSAKAYIDASAPTTRPDTSALTTADRGRLWSQSYAGAIKLYNGTTWIYPEYATQAFSSNIAGTAPWTLPLTSGALSAGTYQCTIWGAVSAAGTFTITVNGLTRTIVAPAAGMWSIMVSITVTTTISVTGTTASAGTIDVQGFCGFRNAFA